MPTFPPGFTGPWCVACCLPRQDLNLTVRDTLTGHAQCVHCGSTDVEWSDPRAPWVNSELWSSTLWQVEQLLATKHNLRPDQIGRLFLIAHSALPTGATLADASESLYYALGQSFQRRASLLDPFRRLLIDRGFLPSTSPPPQ